MNDRNVHSFGVLAGLAFMMAFTLQSASAAVVGTCASGVLVGTTCTLTGSNIIWEYDVDDSNNPGIGLYGDPTLIGDDVRFVPPSFIATSQDGGTVTAGLGFDFIFDSVRTVSGGDLLGVSITEFGDYDIDNRDGNNADEVSANLELIIASNTNAFDFGSSSGSFNDVGDSGGQQTWLIDATWLAASGSPDNPLGPFTDPSDINLRIQNNLRAITTGTDDLAFIQKKLTIGAIVPVPPAIWLFGSALGLLGWVRRKMA
jgi:hypothetical protein